LLNTELWLRDNKVHREHLPEEALRVMRKCEEAAPASCKAFAKLIPDARYVEFEGASHLTFVESRGKYIKTLRQFLTD
jgi:pimeloyl-ACP methyl ester carboxylesterase